MDERVKQVAVRTLTHSAKDFEMLHRVMETELGDRYTAADREQLERVVRSGMNRTIDAVKAL